MGAVDLHVELLHAKWAGSATPLPDGSVLITLPDIPLSTGWNQGSTAVHFLAPNGYPYAKPDCFWADANLRLASGDMPKSANVNVLPGSAGTPALWFSWHTDHWNAARDDLRTWLASVRERLGKAV